MRHAWPIRGSFRKNGIYPFIPSAISTDPIEYYDPTKAYTPDDHDEVPQEPAPSTSTMTQEDPPQACEECGPTSVCDNCVINQNPIF